MAGGIDHVDLHPLVVDADILGKNGDAAFALEIVAVEQADFHLFVFAEKLRLLDDLVHQRGLAVVDVRNNRDIPDFLGHMEPPGEPELRLFRSWLFVIRNCASLHFNDERIASP